MDEFALMDGQLALLDGSAALIGSDGPVDPAPSTGVLVDNVNDGASASTHFPLTIPVRGSGVAAGSVIRIGMAFRQGDLLAAAGVTMKRASGTSVTTQTKPVSFWSDGSVSFAIVEFSDPGLVSGSIENFSMALATPSAATPLSWATVTSGRTCSATIGSQTINLLTAIGGADVWAGPLSISRRGSVALVGMGVNTSARLVWDITISSDGVVELDLAVRNDSCFASGAGSVTGSVLVMGEGVSQMSYGSFTLPLYTAFVRNRRWVSSGAVAGMMATIKPPVAYLSSVGVLEHYDIANAPLAGDYAPGRIADLLASSTWDTPMDPRGITTVMGGTGSRDDIGVNTVIAAYRLFSNDPNAHACAVGQAEAAAGITWHYWSATKNTWVTPLHYPNYRCTHHDSRFTQSSGSPYATDAGHFPDNVWVPYLLTGRRVFLDEIAALGAYALMEENPDYERGGYLTNEADTPAGEAARLAEIRSVGKGVQYQNVQVRAMAWPLRNTVRAAWAVPRMMQPGDSIYIDIAEANYRLRYLDRAVRETGCGQYHGFETRWIYGADDGTFATWQDDIFVQVGVMAARLGIGYASDYLIWKTNWTCGRFTNSSSGFNSADGTRYNVKMGPSLIVFYKTWTFLQSNLPGFSLPQQLWINPPTTNSYGVNYGNLVRNVGDVGGGDYEERTFATLYSLHDLLLDLGADRIQINTAISFLEGAPLDKIFARPADFRSTGNGLLTNITKRGSSRV